MAFDINQQVFDRDGMLIEKKAGRYRHQLMDLFAQSPEVQELREKGFEPTWAGMMIDYGMDYLGLTPPRMSSNDLLEVLLYLFPRKVSAEADEAPAIISELQAFWRFLQREFHLENAIACLSVLNEKTARKLEREMSDPANFGMAKSFVMMGLERGFDMSSQEGVDEWMATYNAELAEGRAPRVPLFGGRNLHGQSYVGGLHLKVPSSKRKKSRKRK
jgi:hypothetical protein